MKESHKNASTGLPNQKNFDSLVVCNKCNVLVDGDYCPKCGRKVTRESINSRCEKDLVDKFPKTRIEFSGISIAQALEIMSNGDCGDR